eukprot:tig00000101_g4437.t1
MPPTDTARLAKLVKSFDLPDDVELKDDFACAVQLQLPFRGRLYVFASPSAPGGWVCFKSSIIGVSHKDCIAASEILRVEKALWGLIPTAIKLVMKDGGEHVYVNFIFRDECYEMLAAAVEAAKPKVRSAPLCAAPRLLAARPAAAAAAAELEGRRGGGRGKVLLAGGAGRTPRETQPDEEEAAKGASGTSGRGAAGAPRGARGKGRGRGGGLVGPQLGLPRRPPAPEAAADTRAPRAPGRGPAAEDEEDEEEVDERRPSARDGSERTAGRSLRDSRKAAAAASAAAAAEEEEEEERRPSAREGRERPAGRPLRDSKRAAAAAEEEEEEGGEAEREPSARSSRPLRESRRPAGQEEAEEERRPSARGSAKAEAGAGDVRSSRGSRRAAAAEEEDAEEAGAKGRAAARSRGVEGGRGRRRVRGQREEGGKGGGGGGLLVRGEHGRGRAAAAAAESGSEVEEDDDEDEEEEESEEGTRPRRGGEEAEEGARGAGRSGGCAGAGAGAEGRGAEAVRVDLQRVTEALMGKERRLQYWEGPAAAVPLSAAMMARCLARWTQVPSFPVRIVIFSMLKASEAMAADKARQDDALAYLLSNATALHCLLARERAEIAEAAPDPAAPVPAETRLELFDMAIGDTATAARRIFALWAGEAVAALTGLVASGMLETRAAASALAFLEDLLGICGRHFLLPSVRSQLFLQLYAALDAGLLRALLAPGRPLPGPLFGFSLRMGLSEFEAWLAERVHPPARGAMFPHLREASQVLMLEPLALLSAETRREVCPRLPAAHVAALLAKLAALEGDAAHPSARECRQVAERLQKEAGAGGGAAGPSVDPRDLFRLELPEARELRARCHDVPAPAALRALPLLAFLFEP